jgi:hypothetical protein
MPSESFETMKAGEFYTAYMLRLWQTTRNGELELWLTVENPHTGKRHTFTSLEYLFAFLTGLTEGLSQKTDLDGTSKGV